jgi:hypothetical protein
LTQKQNQIKKIINDGNIYFKEIYLRWWNQRKQ